MPKYTIGLDFGTLSVRALLVNIVTGEEVGASVYEYPHGVMDTCLSTGEELPKNWALQHPQDYIDGLCYTVKDVVKSCGVSGEEVIGIGVDFTGSTLLPARQDGCPLCLLEEFAREPHAYVKLWKHHGCEKEADDIEKAAKERNEDFLAFYGGNVSSEWMLPKVLETLRYAPGVYEKADRFVDALDWIVWQLTGVEVRSVCVLGYKAFYRDSSGYPSGEFFKTIDSRLENFVEEKIGAPVEPVGKKAGCLTKEWAEKLGLCEGTAVGVGIIDAHASVLGSGITKPNEMIIVVGTSSCHMLLGNTENAIPGIGGVVKDGILPGYYAYEAGQSCVGDQFAWFMDNCVPEKYFTEAKEKNISIHQLMVEKLNGYTAGQSGLIALDWFNGVRSPLMDFDLNGMILGLNLLTKPEEIYLALIESTAYGTRRILDLFEQKGVPIRSIILGGGIPMKNSMLVQVYADVLNRDIRISGTTQACALGAAILGAAAAEGEITGYKNIYEIVEALGKQSEMVWHPRKEQVEIYHKLYEEYKVLCEYFGNGTNDVMKRLNAISASVTVK